jgi:RNA polymerase sigma-70 factor (ECF subfamily)
MAGMGPPHSTGESRRFDLAAAAPRLHRFVARRVRNADDAADIAQQALLLAFEKSGTCRSQDGSGWLFSIARNLIVDHYRARGRFRFLEAGALVDTEPALRTARDHVHVTCEQRQRLACWVGCVRERLPLDEQVAVLLSHVHEYADRDSAAEMELSLASFKLLLHRARARLHAIAGGRCALVGPALAARRASDSRDSRLRALRSRLLEGLGR